MSSGGNRGIAFLFGLLAALLMVVAGVIDLVGGFVFLALGSGGHALGAWVRSVLDVLVGLLVGFLAALGHTGDRERTVAAGAVLVVLALVGWFGLGLGGDLIALVGLLFALIAGILYLVSAS